MGEKMTRFGVLGLLSVLVSGLVWLGVQRHMADQRAVAAATLPPESIAASEPPPTPKPDPASDCTSANSAQKSETILVQIVGAVVNPGVYELPAGARTVDAVKAAGGASPDGNPDALILVQRLSDGDKIWVPAKGEATAAGNPPSVAKNATVVPVASQVASSSAKSTNSAGAVKVNINTASETELTKVSGIGPATAKAIVEYRNSHGRFSKIEDLDNVKGIGPATLGKIRPYLTL